jgi:hypothetical protein
VLQFSLSLLVALLLFFAGGLYLLFGVFQFLERGIDAPGALQSFMLAASFLLGGGLVLPSAWYAIRRLARPAAPAPRLSGRIEIGRLLFTLGLVIIFPLALLAGDQIARTNGLVLLLLPGLNLLVNGLPVLWLALVGLRGLPGGSPQRKWGLFASALVPGPLIIICIELLAMFGLGVLAIVIIASDTGLSREFSFLVARLVNTPPDPDVWVRILSPYFMRPAILGGIIAYIAVLVPLIEEALKPLGLWLLAGRRFSPAEGFVAGVLSGAGFALFENLIATSAGGEGWAMLAVVRISTALLHMLTTGLVGWALAHAWSRGRYFRLAFAYSFSVALHGLWNALGIANFAIPQLFLPDLQSSDLQTLGSLVVIALALLAGVNFIIYLGFNRGLRRSNSPSPVGSGSGVMEDGNANAIIPPPEEETPLQDNPKSD